MILILKNTPTKPSPSSIHVVCCMLWINEYSIAFKNLTHIYQYPTSSVPSLFSSISFYSSSRNSFLPSFFLVFSFSFYPHNNCKEKKCVCVVQTTIQTTTLTTTSIHAHNQAHQLYFFTSSSLKIFLTKTTTKNPIKSDLKKHTETCKK